MNCSNQHRSFRSQKGYTLIEALVAGVILMIGVSAASQLTLALITQDEMSQRTSTVLNYQENAAFLYRMGLSNAEIAKVLPADPAVDSLSVTRSQETVSNSPAVTEIPDMNMEYADITVQFYPSPATQTWTAGIWTGGAKGVSRSLTLRSYRSRNSLTVP